MRTKQAEQCQCGARHWFIHSEANGMGIATCVVCKRDTPEITEIELYLGVPIKANSYSRLNALSPSGSSGLSGRQKADLYRKNKEQIIALYKKDGDVAVLTTYPIHISTWNRTKKQWGLIPDEDRRIITNQRRGKPVGSQMILM